MPLLEVRNLVKHYLPAGLFRRGQAPIRAVDGVSFTIDRGETLALVGESGSGKSTVGRTILRLLDATAGQVVFDGQDVFALEPAALRALRRRMQIIFQDPYSSLNPRMRIGEAVAEGLEIHRLAPRAEIPRRVASLLEEVGLDPAYASRYPHEFSGGQRQRIGIARALAVEPAFLVCDEPVSALDVSVQAQIINLLLDLQRSRGLSYLFIAHDLAVVRQIAQRVAVMYLGKIVELGPTDEVLGSPRHPYTQALLSAVPVPDPVTKRSRIILPGDPPSPANPPPGCRFHTRCFHPARDVRCAAEEPALRTLGRSVVACHYAELPATAAG
ncbi:MAG TPA: oligopeptide/dipeptide ABC transporter ATP-binding protein [Gemmatimonadales bacterium]|jgi:peptide/nickel transport system ATP-binding protein/oligopeptide transport system ATP-binding protein|nr:oligopeptide/dipeptide ABC transporter ATP-binding protein [Gemmatimonadales bacterium]